MNFFWQNKQKVGLALSSGAARGLAHIGTIKALEEAGVKIDMIAGSSIGALVGACFAKNNLKDLEEAALNMDFKNLLKLADPNFFLLAKGFIAGKKVEEFLKGIIGDVEFKDLAIPFLAAATDLESGEEVVIKTGSVVKALRASLSIPAVFTPTKYKGKLLIDGGVASPLPVDILKREGMNFIIASDVVKKPRIHKKLNSEKKIAWPEWFEQKPDDGIPLIFETVMTAIDIMGYQIVKTKIREADFVVSPEVAHIAILEFHRGKEAIAAGYEKAKKNIRENKLIKRLKITQLCEN
ncbi:MAG: patatin-like phospholipase family protein [Candidatus Omnitrophota bacterium]